MTKIFKLKNMQVRELIRVLVVCLTTLSCSQKTVPNAGQSGDGTLSGSPTKDGQDIPYTIAKNYFVNNDYKIEDHPAPKITSQQEFDRIFGKARVMGENGKPTSIDFSKQYVLSVIGQPTDHNTEITPISLKQNAGNILFRYKITEGEKRLVTIQPMLLLIVENKYQGEVQLIKN
jgi:hypothetical protein